MIEVFSTQNLVGSFLIVALSGSIFSLSSKWFSIPQSRRLTIFLWHSIFCVAYAAFVQSSGGDALMYFADSEDARLTPSFGTDGVRYLTRLISNPFTLSFLETSLVFNIFGVVGLMAYDSALQNAIDRRNVGQRILLNVAVFLPSVSFWSAGIGKDAIAFMAAGLATWAFSSTTINWRALGSAVFLMAFVRPHVALVMVFALVTSSLASKSIPIKIRIPVLLLSFLLLFLLAPVVMDFVGLNDNTSIADVNEYVETRQGYNREGGGGIDLATLTLPMQLFSYLFRPLPFEAESLSTLGASIDNVFLMSIFIYALFRTLLYRIRLPMNFIFYVFYSATALTMLAITTANLGISVRQKWMFVPALMFLSLSIISQRDVKKRFSK